MLPRKVAFWLTVGGVAVLSNFVMELAAHKLPWPGLQRFVGFIHSGHGDANANG